MSNTNFGSRTRRFRDLDIDPFAAPDSQSQLRHTGSVASTASSSTASSGDFSRSSTLTSRSSLASSHRDDFKSSRSSRPSSIPPIATTTPNAAETYGSIRRALRPTSPTKSPTKTSSPITAGSPFGGETPRAQTPELSSLRPSSPEKSYDSWFRRRNDIENVSPTRPSRLNSLRDAQARDSLLSGSSARASSSLGFSSSPPKMLNSSVGLEKPWQTQRGGLHDVSRSPLGLLSKEPGRAPSPLTKSVSFKDDEVRRSIDNSTLQLPIRSAEKTTLNAGDSWTARAAEQNDGGPASPDIRHANPKHQRAHSYIESPTFNPSPSSPTKRVDSGRDSPTKGFLSPVLPADSPSLRLTPRPHHSHSHSQPVLPTTLTAPELQKMQKSSVRHLRTLSKIVDSDNDDLFAMPSVATLQNHRQLRRGNTMRLEAREASPTKRKGMTAWATNKLMEKQRQFLQAYEYLCHIGEAKEWIEDVIDRPIPPIVQLEEALRDGVTLAELVQALYPDHTFKIFRHPKLQYRHTDNIALFFNFLDEVDLPDVFRFEMIDLYEKKNIPKVIYCIHALSWLLFKNGVVTFKIGNLVGQLEFEHHELEQMQKGLDKSGVMMPKFDGVGASFGAEPVETEEERIARELAEFEDIFTDLQAQIRGAVGRLMLGDMMESLWENEAQIADLQSRVRGCFARQIFSYRLDMHQANAKLQAACRGFLARRKSKYHNIEMQSIEPQLLAFQSLVRAKKARQEMKHVHNSSVRHERSIAKLQAAIRGAFLRGEYLDQQEETQAAEEDVTYLQAAIRGALTRKRLDYSYEELRHAADPQLCMLQAGIRGALARQAMAKQKVSLRHVETPVQALQALARGYVARQSVHAQRVQMHEQRNEQALCVLQASIKGALARKALQAQTTELAEVSRSRPVEKLQALARGLSLRKKMDGLQSQLRSFEPLWISLQSLSRGRALREATSSDRHKLEHFASLWTSLQSHVRGNLLRQSVASTQAELEAHTSSIVQLQSAIRSALQRNLVDELLNSLEENQDSILALQSHVRGFLCRNDLHNDMEVLGSLIEQLVELQSLSRGAILRVNLDDLLVALEETAPEIEELQGLARGMLTRMSIGTDLMELEAEESVITELQSNIRGFCVRRKFAEKEKFYRENMEKVVKVQSIFRGKVQGEAYRSLTSGKNPPVGTVKGFVHLLNDSDFDFDEEIEFERLRKTVVQQIRQNEVADEHINELDTKIALLLQNKITLDEIVKRQKHFGGHVGAMIANADKDPFDLKALNKDSRRRLEQYQELFFLLQTQPQYIARMFIRLQQQGLPDKDAEAIKHAIMRLFGYAQKRREEYHLVKLIVRSVKEEVAVSPDVAAYERHGNFLWCKVFSIYKNAPKDRQFIGEVLGEFIKHWVLNPQLDLESNPLRIYRSLINNEELRTGHRSRRNPDILEQQAVQDPETKAVFVRNLQDLRDIADHFIASLEDRLHRMPFGVRYIARQMYESLLERFPDEDKGLLLKTTGKWIWKYYFRPAILEPEKHGAIDHGMTQEQKRNLSIIARVIGHLASAMEFGGETRYLNPLNGWLAMRAQHLASIWARVIQVQDAEVYFNIDEFNDLYAKQKPTLYIKLSDISFINRLIRDNVNYICTDPNDILKDVVREMQNEKHEAELMRYSSTEVHLTLTPKLINAEDPDSENRTLMMETKRCVLYIIRVQTAPNLLEIMLKQPTFEDEQRWRKLVRDELSVNSSKRGAYADSGTALADISKLSYQELKATALEHILFLEQRGKVTRANNYQDILNAIAIDIRTKHRRRLQRQKELESARMTLARLNDQAAYLRSQVKTYDTYIEQAMMTLHNKKGKKRFLMPFTKQWDHQRELQKLGREVKFGSYKYSARNLANRGVLVYWKGFSERDWDRVDLTISSNEVGVFMLDGTTGNMVVPKASAQLPLDDLLQAQYNNNQFMDLFDGQLRVNVNLFLHLIMKKFYN